LIIAVGGSGIIEIAIGIGFLVASYFLTKLAWGIAFSLVGKFKNKVLVRVVGTGLIAIFIAGIAYHFVLQRNTGTNTPSNIASSSTQPVGLTNYHVAGNPSFSVNFYKGSKTSSGIGGAGTLTYPTGHLGQSV